jgi:phosphate-selective porin OprO and OprP
VRVRAGKYKSPFSLERLQSARNLLFVERATPPTIAPNRDVGIEVWGELGGGVLWYAAGVFNGVVDGGLADSDNNDGKDLVGRVFVQPFKTGKARALRNLGFGGAGSTGQQAGTTVPAYKSGGQLTFFTYASGITADGNRSRLSPQASYYGGPVTLFAEYVRSSQDLRKSATDTLRVDNSAWGLTGGVLLTGEAATSSSAGVRPRKPIDPTRGQWGALELVARVSALTVDPDAFARGYADPAKSAQKARAYGVGINWYLNRHVKQVVDFERTTYTGGKAGGDRAAENAFFIRTQVAF